MIDILLRAVGSAVWNGVDKMVEKSRKGAEARQQQKWREGQLLRAAENASSNAAIRREIYSKFIQCEIDRIYTENVDAAQFSPDVVSKLATEKFMAKVNGLLSELERKLRDTLALVKTLQERETTAKKIRGIWTERDSEFVRKYVAMRKNYPAGPLTDMQRMHVLQFSEDLHLDEAHCAAAMMVGDHFLKTGVDLVGFMPGWRDSSGEIAQLKENAYCLAKEIVVLRQWVNVGNPFIEGYDASDLSAEIKSLVEGRQSLAFLAARDAVKRRCGC